MNDDEIILEASSIAQKMHVVLVEKMQGQSLEFCFKLGTASLASLIAGYVDAMVQNKYPDQKQKIFESILDLGNKLLIVKDFKRENNH